MYNFNYVYIYTYIDNVYDFTTSKNIEMNTKKILNILNGSNTNL